MPPRKTKQQIADEAWLRAQQLSIEGQLAPSPVPDDRPPVDGIPDTCPGCGRPQTVEKGWTILSEAGQVGPYGHLICGACSHLVIVTPEARDRLRAELHALFARRAAAIAPLPKRERRSRGAE